jgi:hypothetical protein
MAPGTLEERLHYLYVHITTTATMKGFKNRILVCALKFSQEEVIL